MDKNKGMYLCIVLEISASVEGTFFDFQNIPKEQFSIITCLLSLRFERIFLVCAWRVVVMGKKAS